MRIAVFADLHGNRPATQALERELNRLRPDKRYCLGDIVGKGPSSDYTFEWAMHNSDLVLGGNWDIFVGYKSFEPDHYYWKQLGEARLQTFARTAAGNIPFPFPAAASACSTAARL